MRGPKRDILVVVKDQYLSEQDIEQEVQCLNEMLRVTETQEEFCKAHELVDRNRITNRPQKIVKAIQFSELQPFRFLINKN
jgi:hypothetical protein